MTPGDAFNIYKSVQASHIGDAIKDKANGGTAEAIKQEATNKLPARQTLIQIGTIVIGLILAALVASGFSFDIEKLTSAKYYIQVAINYIIMMATYTSVRQMTIDSEKRNKSTAYAQIVATYWSYLQLIINNKLSEQLREKVDEENKRRKLEQADAMLARVSIDLSHKDIAFETRADFETWFNEYTARNLYTKKEKKQLHKLIENILAGRFEYGAFTLEDLINDNEYKSEATKRNSMQLETAKFEAKQTGKKTISFIFSAMILNTLLWNGFSTALIAALITNAFLIGSACMTGMDAGKKYINYRKEIITNRNTFLSTAIKEPTVEVAEK